MCMLTGTEYSANGAVFEHETERNVRHGVVAGDSRRLHLLKSGAPAKHLLRICECRQSSLSLRKLALRTIRTCRHSRRLVGASLLASCSMAWRADSEPHRSTHITAERRWAHGAWSAECPLPSPADYAACSVDIIACANSSQI